MINKITPEMMAAGVEALSNSLVSGFEYPAVARAVYEAMMAKDPNLTVTLKLDADDAIAAIRRLRLSL